MVTFAIGVGVLSLNDHEILRRNWDKSIIIKEGKYDIDQDKKQCKIAMNGLCFEARNHFQCAKKNNNNKSSLQNYI